jgi:hypothetical protein
MFGQHFIDRRSALRWTFTNPENKFPVGRSFVINGRWAVTVSRLTFLSASLPTLWA